MDPIAVLIGGAVGWAIKPNGEIVPIPIGEKLKALKPRFSIPIAIDCSVAHTDEPFNHEGEFIFVRNPTGVSVAVNIKLNETDTPSFPLTELKQMTAPFYRFFITNSAGLGTLNLIVGRGYNFRLVEDVKQGVYLQPEWTAKEGTDKNFYKSYTGALAAAGTYFTYAVPADKTLFISGFSFAIYASVSADGDLNQMGFSYISNHTDTINSAVIGGNGGGAITFTKPLVLSSNKELRGYVYNMSNHTCIIYITAWGYEA